MKTWIALSSLMALLAVTGVARTASARDHGPRLAHIVFFELEDASEEAVGTLVAECEKYLSGHDGTQWFSAGPRAQELNRDVNDQAFHVAVHIVFADQAAHGAYQKAPRHLEFIERNSANWKNVRVFDSYLRD